MGDQAAMPELNTVAFVEWIDAGVVADRWTGWDEVAGEASQLARTPMRSAGLLLERNPDYLVLGLASNVAGGDVSLAMVIPSHAVVRIHTWDLREVPG